MAITYSVSIPNLPSLQAAFTKASELTRQAVTTAINKSLVGYQATAKQLAPIDQGILRGSIQIQPAVWTGNNATGSVGTTTKYAVFQEIGTGIYGPRHTPITPKTKPVLAWFSGGAWHFAKSVKGSKPHWYMRGSVEANQSKTEGYFAQALDDVATQIASTIR